MRRLAAVVLGLVVATGVLVWGLAHPVAAIEVEEAPAQPQQLFTAPVPVGEVAAAPLDQVAPGAPQGPLLITVQPQPPVPVVSVLGVVIDEDDARVAGATIEGIVSPVAGGGSSQRTHTTSGVEGQFSLEIPVGAIVSVTASEGGRTSARVRVAASSSLRLKLLARSSALSGRVVAHDGKAIETFQVRLHSEEFNFQATFRSPDGQYRVERLPSVEVTVEVSATGFIDAVSEHVILTRAQERTGLDFTLERGQTLAGVVFEEQSIKPIDGASVRVLGQPRRLQNGAATSDETGSFQLQGLRGGRLELRVKREGYRARDVVVEVGAPQAARIGLARAAEADQAGALDYEGVGMRFEDSAAPPAGGGYRVVELHPEGGARVAGVELGDEILAAGGLSASAIPIDEFLRHIKGEEGTVVKLTIRRGERTFDLHAVRRRLYWAPH